MKSGIVAAGVFLAGCTHMSHGAYVDPGWSMGVDAGAAVEHIVPGAGEQGPHMAPTRTLADLQLRTGYGWRFNKGKQGASLTLVVPTRSLAGTTLDAYLQMGSGPLDLGLGVFLGLGPEVYLEMGHRFEVAGLDISGGARLGSANDASNQSVPMYTGFLLISVSPTDELRVGLWAEYQDPSGVFKRCDENCTDDDYLDYRIAGGIMMTVRPGAH